MDWISFYAHMVFSEGVSIDLAVIENVISLDQPFNTKYIQRLLRQVGYYQRFIQDISCIFAPLTSLVKKGFNFI